MKNNSKNDKGIRNNINNNNVKKLILLFLNFNISIKKNIKHKIDIIIL